MPNLPTRSFTTIVSSTVAGIQGRASKLINFSTGSTLRAIVEGFAGLFLWFQALVLKLLTAIRLSTSQGVDVDTFTADFMPTIGTFNGVASPRLGAQSASGVVTFGRQTAGPSTCFIPVGATLRASDGSLEFAVTADATFGSYSALLGGYTLPAAVATINVPVAAVVAGSKGNVAAGAITVITSAITGIDYVFNGAAFTNGADFESDNSLKSRFAAYILGLSRGDIYGLAASIEGANVNIQWTLTEDFNLDGTYHPGYFFVIADDGSGAPSADFLAIVTTAVQAVRPLGIMAGVFSATIIYAVPSMIITTAPGYNHATVVAQVAAALKLGINSLGLGVLLEFGMLYSWAYAIPGVTNVTAVQINSMSGDAASIHTMRYASDGITPINYATVKCITTVVS